MATSYIVKFTNGTSRKFLAHTLNGAREAAFAWLCWHYATAPVFIASVNAT